MALCFRLYCIDRSMALWLKLNVMVLHPNAKRCFLIKHTRFIQTHSKLKLVLGIESTFDDTGAAVVDADGNVLGDALNTQSMEHVKSGGVDPRIAQIVHQEVLPNVTNQAMKKAGITYADLNAVATATRPGLPFCLLEGLNFSKKLVAKHRLPFIPVHHMEAHMLTVTMESDVRFPFLTLLVSGGHCIICLAQGLGQYKILGNAVDVPPGSALDKVARELKMGEDQPDKLNKAEDLEKFAKQGNMSNIQFTMPLMKRRPRCCDFSFSGLMSQAHNAIRHSVHDHADIAARLQHSIFLHIVQKLHRAIIFCKQTNLLGDGSAVVASGGVVRNDYLRKGLANLCDYTNMSLVCPPPYLCVDNGIMIAWTGMAYLKAGLGVSPDPEAERFEPKCPLGEDISDQIMSRKIKLPRRKYFESTAAGP